MSLTERVIIRDEKQKEMDEMVEKLHSSINSLGGHPDLDFAEMEVYSAVCSLCLCLKELRAVSNAITETVQSAFVYEGSQPEDEDPCLPEGPPNGCPFDEDVEGAVSVVAADASFLGKIKEFDSAADNNDDFSMLRDFLTEKDAWHHFISEATNSCEEILKQPSSEYLLTFAAWHETTQGHKYWSVLHLEWQDLLQDVLQDM